MMRNRGLTFAWIALLVVLLGAVGYAEFAYRSGEGAGEAPPGKAASGAAIDPGPGGQGAESGTALTGAPATGEGPAGRAVDTAPAPPPASPASPVAAPAEPPAPPPAAIPADRILPPARVAYAAPPPPDDGRPRIAIIMTEIGLGRARSRQAIERLPGPVTLAVMAYADGREEWLRAARAAGHETLLAVPLEPIDYPRFDPGPDPLLIDLSDLENLARLDRALTGAGGYVGVLSHMGARFLATPDRLRPVLAATQDRGLIFVDNRSGPDSAVADLARTLDLYTLANDRFIDDSPSRALIERRLEELEAIAKRRGYAVGIATPYPVSIEQIRRWAEGLEAKGLVLAPVSALARRPAP